MSNSYPKWLYHAAKGAQLVDTEEAHKALGAGWAESPADVKPEPVKPEAPKAHAAPHAHASFEDETHPKKHK